MVEEVVTGPAGEQSIQVCLAVTLDVCWWEGMVVGVVVFSTTTMCSKGDGGAGDGESVKLCKNGRNTAMVVMAGSRIV